MLTGLFLAEGTSDAPLADLVTTMFAVHGVTVQLTRPDFALLGDRVARDVASRLVAGRTLMADQPLDLLVVHRDVDRSDRPTRLQEILAATRGSGAEVVPVLPVRMTEAWLLLDDNALRAVAGNPAGRTDLGLPQLGEVERLADPKARLRAALLAASDTTGRRRLRFEQRFGQHRRQLLDRLDPAGPVTQLSGWQHLLRDVASTAQVWLRP